MTLKRPTSRDRPGSTNPIHTSWTFAWSGGERGRLDADLVHPRAVGAERAPRLAVAARVGVGGGEREVRLLVVGIALEHAQQEAHGAVVVAGRARVVGQAPRDAHVDVACVLARADRPVLVEVLLEQVAGVRTLGDEQPLARLGAVA